MKFLSLVAFAASFAVLGGHAQDAAPLPTDTTLSQTASMDAADVEGQAVEETTDMTADVDLTEDLPQDVEAEQVDSDMTDTPIAKTQTSTETESQD